MTEIFANYLFGIETWMGRLGPFSDEIVACREIHVDTVYTMSSRAIPPRGQPRGDEINDSIVTMNNTGATVKRGSGSDRVRPQGCPEGNHP